MTVYDLIQKLSKLPQDAEVNIVNGTSLAMFAVGEVRQMKKSFSKIKPVLIEAKGSSL